ncbi:MAG: hypothetical protein CK532_06950 [Flavobacteriales bacterium]|nr:MAG: hypothetical protein CK532_06950 [Flavobacteriales bacterium]
MKKLISLAILIPSFLLGQSSLESKVLRELNKYRNQFDLRSLPYDAKASAASRHHSSWMNLSGGMGHEQNKDVQNFQELKTIEDRNNFFKVDMFAEIVTVVSSNSFMGFPLSEDVIAESTISNFASSPKHNETMKMFIREEIPVGVSIGVVRGKDLAAVTINFVGL